MPYEVHLEIYDGPFDLLLRLITAQQVELYDISLKDVVDAFLAEVAAMRAADLEVMTEFLLIAATLVELKCKRLLPGGDDVELDEELALYEARDYLLARLVEAKMFSETGRALARLEADWGRAHARHSGPDERFDAVEPDLLEGVTAEILRRLAVAALAPRPAAVVETAHVLIDEVSVRDTLAGLVAELPNLGTTTLRQLGESRGGTAAFVALFLALLELYKQGLVELDQLERFGDVTVVWTGDDKDLHEVEDDYDAPVDRTRR